MTRDHAPGEPSDHAPGEPSDHAPGEPSDRAPGEPSDRAPGEPSDRAPGGQSGEPSGLRLPDRAWLARPVLDVARDLLGATVTTHSPEGIVTVRLTEVEAYDGERDPGSHAYRGRTPRNAVMFGPAGHLYVYRHLGLHHCANVVTGVEGHASAVLLRAGEVVQGRDVARRRRLESGVVRHDVDLARGPARLAVALGLDLGLYGLDLLAPQSPVRLAVGRSPARWATGPRVGVSGAGGAADDFPWRFWLPGDQTVSAYRAAEPRRRRPPAAGHRPASR